MVTAATRAAMVSFVRGASSPMRTASMSKPWVLRVRNSCSIAQRRRYRSATAKASAASATGSVVRSRQCTPSPAGGSTSRTSTRLRTTLFGKPVRTPSVGRASSTAMKRTATSASRAVRPGFAGSLSRARPPSARASARPNSRPPSPRLRSWAARTTSSVAAGRSAKAAKMSLSRSAITVTRAALAPTSAARPAPSSQRRLSFSASGREPRADRRPASRARKQACISPRIAPSPSSTAKTACRKRPPPPCEVTPVVSWIARTARPAQRAAVRAAASAAISSTVTDGLRRKRVRRISPARLAPSRRTRTPRPPVSTRRACRNAPLFPGGGRQTAPAKAPSPDPPSSHDRESDIASPLKPKCVNAVGPNGRGAGVRAPAEGQKAAQAPPRRAVPPLLLPLAGRTDPAEGRARRGSPGMEHLTDEGLKVRQPQGPGLTDRVGLAPAADAALAGFDRQLYARRPPPRSAFGRVGPPPQGGRESAPALCESASLFGRGGRGEDPGRRTEGSAGSAAKDSPSPGRAPRDSTSPIRERWRVVSARTIESDAMQPDTHYAKSGDVRIAYQVFGQGAFDLVYVPGFVSNIDLYWDYPAMAH